MAASKAGNSPQKPALYSRDLAIILLMALFISTGDHGTPLHAVPHVFGLPCMESVDLHVARKAGVEGRTMLPD